VIERIPYFKTNSKIETIRSRIQRISISVMSNLIIDNLILSDQPSTEEEIPEWLYNVNDVWHWPTNNTEIHNTLIHSNSWYNTTPNVSIVNPTLYPTVDCVLLELPSSESTFDCGICYKSSTEDQRLVSTCCRRQDTCHYCVKAWIDIHRNRPCCAFCRRQIVCVETSSEEMFRMIQTHYS